MPRTMDDSSDNNDDQPLDFSRKEPAPTNGTTATNGMQQLPPPQQRSLDLSPEQTQNLLRTTPDRVLSWPLKNERTPPIIEKPQPEPSHLTTPSPSPPEPTTVTSSPQVLCQLLTNSLFNNHHNSSPANNNKTSASNGNKNGSSGVDRFGTSGGLLTTTLTPSALQPQADAGQQRSSGKSVKYTRPFKAYPRELTMPMNYLTNYALPHLQLPISHDAIATQSLLATASDQQYLQFREQMLHQKRNQQEPRKKSTGSTNSDPLSSPTSLVGSQSVQSQRDQVKAELDQQHREHQQQHQFQQQALAAMVRSQQATSGPQLSDENSQISNGDTSSGGESEQHPTTPRSMTPYGVSGSMSQLGHSGGSGGGGSNSTRKRGRPLPEDLKDEAYWERRRKNNEAAKRSRDARRAKEDEIAIRAAFLEQENLKLRVEVAALKSETSKLRCLLYNN